MPFAEEHRLVDGLRRRDEAAFTALVDRYGPSLLRVAGTFVPSRAVAEEVVQETWLGVLRGIERFEGRSSLKTWLFRILVNTARTRGVRERRSVPFSSLVAEETAANGEVVDSDRFFPADHDRYPHHWSIGPTPWATPEDGVLNGETRDVILGAIEELRPAQRTVITLRDIEGWPSAEVCEALEVSDANQRVLLHRARSKVRAALERHLGAVEVTV